MTHYGWEDGRTLCGAFRGFGARWAPGKSGPGVTCPECISRNAALPPEKRFP